MLALPKTSLLLHAARTTARRGRLATLLLHQLVLLCRLNLLLHYQLLLLLDLAHDWRRQILARATARCLFCLGFHQLALLLSSCLVVIVIVVVKLVVSPDWASRSRRWGWVWLWRWRLPVLLLWRRSRWRWPSTWVMSPHVTLRWTHGDWHDSLWQRPPWRAPLSDPGRHIK
jgi:hypothetical protein